MSNSLWPNHLCSTTFGPIIHVRRPLAQSFMSDGLWPNHSCLTAFGSIIHVQWPFKKLGIYNTHSYFKSTNPWSLCRSSIWKATYLKNIFTKILLIVFCRWICPWTRPYTLHNTYGSQTIQSILNSYIPLRLLSYHFNSFTMLNACLRVLRNERERKTNHKTTFQNV